MYNIANYKRLSLLAILDQYATRNAIIDFLDRDHSEFIEALIKNNSKNENRINNYIKYLKKELAEIEVYLNDEENVDWQTLGIKKELFDKKLPKHKRKIEWFRSVDRYPFDHSIFYNIVGEMPITN